ncbi:MAG TPA: redox-sensing transcriptional repressor Rex [Candidatus Gallimonas intestinavium]|uniref:Redox-sensing transcriptional repressor Rex n=1 Tax=Candidatus Gallimonas intestinavium TaxID=2838603 RepID=A0A9D2K0Z4_9FIRM|nr:redox-sensing transcriptional repressor Rex [Candidatus Gallimonas intestinavium]
MTRLEGKTAEISKAAFLRFPEYLRYLKAEAARGVEYVSSSEIAEDMHLSAVCVRKDLALVASEPGKPRMGFAVMQLIGDLERALGYHRKTHACVVGAGRLGRAFLVYDGFEHYGISVVAAFDISPAQVGALRGKPIYPMERLKEIAEREEVRLGILTVPGEAAQKACDAMVEAGITAILSFAPAYVRVPEGVTLRCEDLAATLASLSAEAAENGDH